MLWCYQNLNYHSKQIIIVMLLNPSFSSLFIYCCYRISCVSVFLCNNCITITASWFPPQQTMCEIRLTSFALSSGISRLSCLENTCSFILIIFKILAFALFHAMLTTLEMINKWWFLYRDELLIFMSFRPFNKTKWKSKSILNHNCFLIV